jgi:hypothetical protein
MGFMARSRLGSGTARLRCGCRSRRSTGRGELYLRNWLRIIPDARYAPVPLEPSLRPDTGAPLDLTFAVLRSVSPIHLEYLANMGIRCSRFSRT